MRKRESFELTFYLLLSFILLAYFGSRIKNEYEGKTKYSLSLPTSKYFSLQWSYKRIGRKPFSLNAYHVNNCLRLLKLKRQYTLSFSHARKKPATWILCGRNQVRFFLSAITGIFLRSWISFCVEVKMIRSMVPALSTFLFFHQSIIGRCIQRLS